MMRGPRIQRRFTITYMLIALNVIVYVYTSYLSGNPWITDENVVLPTYGQDNLLVMNGAYYQLITSMFVHVSIEHLVGNMLFLLIFGLRAEELFEADEYILIYLLSGLAGNLLSLLPTLLAGIDMLSAGASGAIFGVFGAVVIYARRSVGQSIITALMFAFFLFIINIGPTVNVFAHLGGLIVGLLIGYLLAATRRPGSTYRFSYKYSA
jgi:rhomboid protease GluP